MVSTMKPTRLALSIFIVAVLSLLSSSNAQQWTPHGCPNPVFEYMKSNIYVPTNQQCADSALSGPGVDMFAPCSATTQSQFVEHLLYQPLSTSWIHRLPGYGPIRSGYKCLGLDNDTALEGLGFRNISVQVWFQNCTYISNAPEDSTACNGKQMLKQKTFDSNGFGIWVFQRNNQNSAQSTSADEDDVEHCLAYSHSGNSSSNGTLVIQGNCTGDGNADHRNFFRIQCANVVMRNDPEVVNMKGERFKVVTTGGLTLLHVPRDAPVSKAVLVIVADIQELENSKAMTIIKGKPCAKTYVRHLLLTGTALGDLTALTFHARNQSSPFMMGFGNHLHWVPDGRMTQEEISEQTLKIGVPRNMSIVIIPNKHKPGTPKEIRIKLGAVSITVSSPHTQRGKDWHWLNLQVTGLEELSHTYGEIGGVLGSDSPRASSQNKCLENARRKTMLKQVNDSWDLARLMEVEISTV
eukprot:gnl/TRDRNA2_/TRDRNA2_174828_c7_seq1.p1 gnl/TRDRNA2_/TRDRNA2_174828_c7~~gnl/TRDRNA2_/TRDRNA2_174828_c7_seq1.p1  ORF type:complete len:466 (-),score=22.33 gnl/TRDRNA2_/TRDRNA2_174828_c7_seq1:142-1539(-)